jgi:hypothetical protein
VSGKSADGALISRQQTSSAGEDPRAFEARAVPSRGEEDRTRAPVQGPVSMRRLLGSLILSAACLSLTACAGVTQNVRAYRAYALEEPSLAVAMDRAEDIAKTLELVETILLETPYTPGDAWVAELALKDDEAKEIKASIKEKDPYTSGEHEVPVAKVYRIHLERVLEKAPKAGEYPSLLDGLAALSEGSADLKTHWGTLRARHADLATAQAAYDKEYDNIRATMRPGEAFQETVELKAAKAKLEEVKGQVEDAQKKLDKDFEALTAVKADEGKRGQTIKDGTAAVSVAYRLELEASALIPIVAVQAVRSIPKAGKEMTESPALVKGIKKLEDLPDFITHVRERMVRQVDLLETMTKLLATASATTLEQTPGFALRETVVDQVVGVTVDSFRVNVKAGAEAFFFTSLAKAEKDAGSSDSKETFDYTGRQYKLKYQVKPILLASGNFNVGFDWIRLPNAANFNLGYKTDRVFSSGGKIENGSLGEQLGVNGVASDALDFGLGVLGVKTNVRIAKFTAGEVILQDAYNDNELARAPFQIAYTQIDAGYDVAFLMGEKAGKNYVEEAVIGVRYMNYRLPRILYELENHGTDDNKRWEYVRETPVQLVVSKYYMAGLSGRMGLGPGPALSPFVDIGIYAGVGPSAYYFMKPDPRLSNSGYTYDSPELRDHQSKTSIVANASFALGARYRLAPRTSRFRLNIEVIYRAEAIYARANGESSDQAKTSKCTAEKCDRIVDFGATDLFHGPRLSLVGEF